MAENDTNDQHTVEYVGSAAVWRQSGRGRVATQANPRIGGLEKAEADTLVANHDFEHVDEADIEDEPDEAPVEAPEPEPEPEAPEPLDGTVAELEDALATGEWDDQLVDLYNLEREHKDRSGAIDAIQDRRDELRDTVSGTQNPDEAGEEPVAEPESGEEE